MLEATREWGAWVISLLALYLTWKQHKASVAEPEPTINIGLPAWKGDGDQPYVLVTLEVWNHSDKPLVVTGLKLRGLGRLRYSRGRHYDAYGGVAGHKDFDAESAPLPPRISPTGTHASVINVGDHYHGELAFQMDRPRAMGGKLCVSYRFGSSGSKVLRAKFQLLVPEPPSRTTEVSCMEGSDRRLGEVSQGEGVAHRS